MPALFFYLSLLLSLSLSHPPPPPFFPPAAVVALLVSKAPSPPACPQTCSRGAMERTKRRREHIARTGKLIPEYTPPPPPFTPILSNQSICLEQIWSKAVKAGARAPVVGLFNCLAQGHSDRRTWLWSGVGPAAGLAFSFHHLCFSYFTQTVLPCAKQKKRWEIHSLSLWASFLQRCQASESCFCLENTREVARAFAVRSSNIYI